MVVVGVDLIGAWDRVREGGGRVDFVVVSAIVPVTRVVVVVIFGVVRVGAVVRSGGVVVICCCCEEREATVCLRDGERVALLRTVVLTSLVRGARVDEAALLLSSKVMREAVVRSLRGAGVSFGGTLGRSVPLGTRVGGVGF